MKIGIDLGTTNSALSWMDPSDDDQTIQVFDIPQFVAQGRQESQRTLPSFLYLGDQTYVGAYAREQGALTPTRTVHSAKSWLSNADVDRRAKILPWDTQESARELSPVEVSARYLAHMRQAWDAAHPDHPLAQQDIVLTVPASFDEEARELTVEAAREAGLENLTLLEEPAAAFYSWIANHLAESQKTLFDGQTVLVCDVGGGTSDFTLIKVSRQGDLVEFTRTAVGRHLLLGGDNLDLTLAWLVEAKLGQQLSLRQRSALRRQCAAAKERMLNNPAVEKVEITVLGSGSSLIGGTLRTEITRAEALELALDGFLPACALSDGPPTTSAPSSASSACPTFRTPPSRSISPPSWPAPAASCRMPFSSTAASSSLKSSASASPMCSKAGTAAVRSSLRTATLILPSPSAPPTMPTLAAPAPACWSAAACPGLTISASANRPIR
jgi:molecular chaperone DnaK (HSP70)